jgi:hypothetical protein
MTALQGAVESAAPVSRLHQHRSLDPADFGVPTGREEEWRFTPLPCAACGIDTRPAAHRHARASPVWHAMT